MNYFDFKLNCPTRFIFTVNRNEKSTCYTTAFANVVFADQNDWILAIVDGSVTDKVIVVATDFIDLSLLVFYHFCVGLELSNVLSDVDPSVDFIDKAEAKNFQDSIMSPSRHNIASSLRQHS